MVELVDLLNSFMIFLSLTTLDYFLPTRISDWSCHIPTLSLLFLSSYPSVCSALIFPPFGNLENVPALDSNDVLLNSEGGCSFFTVHTQT